MQVRLRLAAAECRDAVAGLTGITSAGHHAMDQEFQKLGLVKSLTTAHPFDSHPPLGQRLQALGFSTTSAAIRPEPASADDGPWFHEIVGADELERALWKSYEDGFRQFHENVLAFRYLPSTPEERAIVEKYFPEIDLESSKGRKVTFDCEKMTFEAWEAPVHYAEIQNITATTDWGQPRLDLTVARDGATSVIALPLNPKQAAQQRLIDALQHYSGRHAAAVAYRESLEEPGSEGRPPVGE